MWALSGTENASWIPDVRFAMTVVSEMNNERHKSPRPHLLDLQMFKIDLLNTLQSYNKFHKLYYKKNQTYTFRNSF